MTSLVDSPSSVDITLKEISAETVRDFCDLRVHPDQAIYVATNAESIAQAYFHPEAWFRGIYAGDEPVGFVMLEDWSHVPDCDPTAPICLWRFSIDDRFQGRGYGRRALELVVEHVRARDRLGYMLTSCLEGEHSPKPFYLKFGFYETGEISDGETVLRYDL
jgi:diamine N-acetyltransferase